MCNFADDTTFYACDKDLGSLVIRLEHDSLLAIEWFEKWFETKSRKVSFLSFCAETRKYLGKDGTN